MVSTEVAFRGSAADKALAEKLFQVMTGFARFSSYDAPIRLAAGELSEFLGTTGTEATPEKLQSIVKANSSVFAAETTEDGVYLLTTRAGRSPVATSSDSAHTFAVRFMTPLPKPERPLVPRQRVPAPEPDWLRDVILPSEAVAPRADTLSIVSPVVEPDVIAPLSVLEAVAPELVEPPIEAPVIEETPVARTITVPPVGAQSFATVDDIRLATAVGERLRLDPRVANFGEDWMLEERVPRLGRNDLRRLKDYLQEQEQPLTDDVLATDVLGGRPGSPDFDQLRFAVNFRLSREHRDFDFVGTVNQRFWSTGSLPQIGTTRKKPTEIASDYRSLAEDPSQQAAPRSVASIDHVLTFYEYHLGLLPYDRDLQGLMPAPLQPNQRSAVLTFECPQSYTTYLVELRYPTPNRGGFILGLDDFYNENLVPGALIAIERTENDGHYLVRYIQEKPTSARLLEIEDRRLR